MRDDTTTIGMVIKELKMTRVDETKLRKRHTTPRARNKNRARLGEESKCEVCTQLKIQNYDLGELK